MVTNTPTISRVKSSTFATIKVAVNDYRVPTESVTNNQDGQRRDDEFFVSILHVLFFFYHFCDKPHFYRYARERYKQKNATKTA